jgi:hypothetical protein
MTWLDDFDQIELESIVRKRAGASYSGAMSIDDLGAELTLGIRNSERGFGFEDQLWSQLKSEFRLLICDTGTKYADIRKQAGDLGRHGQTAIVALLAGALGSAIGVSAAAIAPAVALLVLAAVKIGREAFCKTLDLRVTLDGANGK